MNGEGRSEATLFISGHSLVDQPLPGFLASIAESMGTPLRWNRQYVVGSSIERRVRGPDVLGTSWDGYRDGLNRDSENMDVLSELQSGATVEGRKYNVLLITEQHVLMEALLGNDTVRYLREYHDRFIEGNAQGTTIFFQPWLSLSSLDDPSRWLAYEQAASKAWQCAAVRVNHSLEAEGRADRIRAFPANLAVAELVKRVTEPPGLPGITLGSTRETLESLLWDTVHLRPIGVYYMALVTYGHIFGRSPVGAWYPPELSPLQAESLQQVAWDFLSTSNGSLTGATLAGCRDYMLEFNGDFWAYMRDGYWVEQKLSAPRRMARWARKYWESRDTLRADDASNPFFYDPVNDRRYWFRVADE